MIRWRGYTAAVRAAAAAATARARYQLTAWLGRSYEELEPRPDLPRAVATMKPRPRAD